MHVCLFCFWRPNKEILVGVVDENHKIKTCTVALLASILLQNGRNHHPFKCNIMCSAESGWLEDNCPSAEAVDVMPPGSERDVLQGFRRHFRFHKTTLSEHDRLQLEVAKGGI